MSRSFNKSAVRLLSSVHSAKYVSAVSSRGVTHGLSLLGVFIYKYIADTSFVTVSCRSSAQGFVSQQMHDYQSVQEIAFYHML